MIDNTDGIEGLYNRFREALSTRDELFFEEDELIDIFDYANESADVYICRSVLSLGERLYPDSDELRVRQGILYAGDIFNERESLHRFMQDNTARTGTMWDILSLYLIPKEDVAAIENAFEEFVSTHRLEEDEESVQFFNVVMYHDRLDWLIDEIDRLRKICDYDFTLMYDVAQIAREKGREDVSIRLLEEMTETEPFSIDLWLLLAKSYDDAGCHADATAALDYARAVDSQNQMLRIYECERSVTYDLDPVQKQIELLESLRQDIPDNSFLTSMLVNLYRQTGDSKSARDLYMPIFKQSPGSISILAEMLSVDQDGADKYISMFEKAYKASHDGGLSDEEQFDETTAPLQMLMVKSVKDNPDLSYKIVRLLLRMDTNEDAERNYLMAMHLSDMNEEAFERINDMLREDAIKPEKVLLLSPLIGAIMLVTGRVDEAYEWSRIANEKIIESEPTDYIHSMLIRGVRMALHQVCMLAQEYGESDGEIPENPLNLQLDELFLD